MPDAVITNALTIDVEDYFQVSAFGPYIARADWEARECRVERNVDRILALLDEHDTQATFFTLGWVAGFDVLYATLDEAHDRSAGIRSLPGCYGRPAALRASRALQGGGWALLATLALWRLAWPAALLPLLAVAALLVWEQRRADDVDLAFFRINVWVGVMALATVVAGVWGARG